MKTIILATHNEGKVREMRRLLPDYTVCSLKDLGVEMDVEETGQTFLENAHIKASAIASLLKDRGISFDYVVSDDSGMEIDFFDKKPGIYSSRWLGEETPYEEKNRIILERMKDVPEEGRSARYVCAISCIQESGREHQVQETAEGYIALEPKGSGGFGYDPIFYFPGLGTFAQIPLSVKNRVSHRGKALRSIAELLKKDAL